MTMKFCFTLKKKHNTPPDWIIFFMLQLDLAVMYTVKNGFYTYKYLAFLCTWV